MIPEAAITAWAGTHPWPTRAQIEQDLLLSRALVAIAAHPYLGEELAFRGGTALHKLHLARPYRYSEDLDYVRASAGGIRELTRALTDVGHELGLEVSTRISEHPKVYFRALSERGLKIRIKVEVNTHERSPAHAHPLVRHEVNSRWWSGSADVRTFVPAELVATKIRALYQRSKGRDLFDLWLALTQLDVDPHDVLAAFATYRPHGLTSVPAMTNLRAKLTDPRFRDDLEPLLVAVPAGYAIETAAELVIDELLRKL